jgi:hypothetical protein
MCLLLLVCRSDLGVYFAKNNSILWDGSGEVILQARKLKKVAKDKDNKTTEEEEPKRVCCLWCLFVCLFVVSAQSKSLGFARHRKTEGQEEEVDEAGVRRQDGAETDSSSNTEEAEEAHQGLVFFLLSHFETENFLD